MKSSLKQKSKLIKIYYNYDLKKSDHIEVLQKSTICTNTILEAKKDYILKMTTKLEDSNTAQKLIEQY